VGEGALLVTGGARVREMRENEARRGARISLSLSSYYYYLYLAFHPQFFYRKAHAIERGN